MNGTDTCRGCEGIQVLTPQPIFNRAALDQLRYRVGNHPAFFETMLARISEIERATADSGASSVAARALERLMTRKPDDPSIALLDAWATVASVLSFYQERIANEAFLRTATERRSVEELARLVGYDLRPGLASSVLLAFEVDDQSDDVLIPKGTPAKSTPVPGSSTQPQTFETSEDFICRRHWNVIRPRLTRPMTSLLTRSQIYFKGTGLRIAPNDILAISDNSTDIPDPLSVVSVREKNDLNQPATIVTVLTDLIVDKIDAIVRQFLASVDVIKLFYPRYISLIQERFRDHVNAARVALRVGRLEGADAYLEREFVAKDLIADSPLLNSVAAEALEMQTWYINKAKLFSFDSNVSPYKPLRALYKSHHVGPLNTVVQWKAVVDNVATSQPTHSGKVAMAWRDLWSHAYLANGESQPGIYIGLDSVTEVTAAADKISPLPQVLLGDLPTITHVSVTAISTGSVTPTLLTAEKPVGASALTAIEGLIGDIQRGAADASYNFVLINVLGRNGANPSQILATGIQRIKDHTTNVPVDFDQLEHDKVVVSLDSPTSPIHIDDGFGLSSAPTGTDYKVTAQFEHGSGVIRKMGMPWPPLAGETGTANALAMELNKLELSSAIPVNSRVTIRFTFEPGAGGAPIAFALRTVFYANQTTSISVRRRLGKFVGEMSRNVPDATRLPAYGSQLQSQVIDKFQTLINDVNESETLSAVIQESQNVTFEGIRNRLLENQDVQFKTTLLNAWDQLITDADDLSKLSSHEYAKLTGETVAFIKDKLQRTAGFPPPGILLLDLAKDFDARLAKPNPAYPTDGIQDRLTKERAIYAGLCNTVIGIFNVLAKSIMSELHAKRDEFISALDVVQSGAMTGFGPVSPGTSEANVRDLITNEFDATSGETAKARVAKCKALIEDTGQPLKAADVSATKTTITQLINLFQDRIDKIETHLPIAGAQNAIAKAVIGGWRRIISRNRGQVISIRGTATNPEDLLQRIVDATKSSGALNSRDLQELFTVGSNLWPQIQATLQPDDKHRIYDQMRKFRIQDVEEPVAYIYRATANLYGWNSPGVQRTDISDPTTIRTVPDRIDPVLYTTTVENEVDENHELPNRVFLDGDFKKTKAGTFVAIQKSPSGLPRNLGIIETKAFPRTLYGLSGNTTRVIVDEDRHERGWWNPPSPGISGTPDAYKVLREARVWCDAERLLLAEEMLYEEPEHEVLQPADVIVLDKVYPDLTTQAKLIVEGVRFVDEVAEPGNVLDRELVEVVGLEHTVDESVFGDRIVTKIKLARPFVYPYWLESVRIYANLVEATHGESFDQVLGDGNGATSFQRFSLNKAPVTRLPNATPRGAKDEIKTRVNSVLWEQADHLADAKSQEPVYEVGQDRAGNPQIQFGDGVRGARLPSGTENVRARYRAGLGTAGNVDADLINQMSAPPLGARSVRNPLRASGGADEDSLEQARLRAGCATMSLNKLVSLADYRNFALFFAGIDKVKARTEAGKVCLTVASTAPEPLLESGALLRNLRKALRDYGDPTVVVVLNSHEPLLLFIAADVAIDPGYKWDTVETEIRARLLDRFSYRRSEFGQDILSADVQAIIQGVEGVTFVDLNDLRTLQNSSSSSDSNVRTPTPNSRLQVGRDQLCFLDPEVPDMLILEQAS